MLFNKTSDGTQLESIAWDGGRIVAEPDGWGGTNMVPYLYSTDHLGSVRAVRNALTGAVVSGSDYEPYGAHTTLSGTPQRYRYNGKEDQSFAGTPYLDYGARQYDPFTGSWKVPDPLAEKYYSVSPYLYCNSNPLRFVDLEGKEVYAIDNLSKSNIKRTLSKKEARYVRFDKKGRLNTRRLNRSKSSSENMTALKALANSDTKYYFSVSSNDGKQSFFEKGTYADRPNDYYYGVTKMPGMRENPSPNNNVYIVTADFLDEGKMVENVAHEGYGHAYFFELHKTNPEINPNHQMINEGEVQEVYDEEYNMNIYAPVFVEGNSQLEQWIYRVVKQAKENYERWID